MARIITRELADKITTKLGGVVQKTASKHELVSIVVDGKVVATYGLRRASEKDKGHDYIPGQIFVGPNFAKQLGQCTKSKAPGSHARGCDTEKLAVGRSVL